MKHKLRRSCLILTLAMLCTLLYAGAASASSPQLSVKVDNGDEPVTATTTHFPEDPEHSEGKKYYYMVSIEKPDEVESFQTGWSSDVNANEPEQWDTVKWSPCQDHVPQIYRERASS